MIFRNMKILILRLKRSKEKRKLNQINRITMFAWLRKIFNSESNSEAPDIKLTTLSDIDIFDTVWIKDEDNIYEGWIFDKTKKRLVIVAGSNEYIIHYTRPFTQTKIEFNNKILYFNKPC